MSDINSFEATAEGIGLNNHDFNTGKVYVSQDADVISFRTSNERYSTHNLHPLGTIAEKRITDLNNPALRSNSDFNYHQGIKKDQDVVVNTDNKYNYNSKNVNGFKDSYRYANNT